MQLSIRMPASAAITCSIISTVASPCLIVVRRADGNNPIDPRGHPRPIGQVDPLEDNAGAGFGRPEAKRDVGPVEEPMPAHLGRVGKRALPDAWLAAFPTPSMTASRKRSGRSVLVGSAPELPGQRRFRGRRSGLAPHRCPRRGVVGQRPCIGD